MSRSSESRFAQNLDAALDDASAGLTNAWSQLFVVAAMMAGLLAWAHFAVLEEVVVGTGRVIPSQQLQVVQTADGGVVTEILVSEGQSLKAGDLMMRIDATTSQAQLGELRQRRWALNASVTRLEAEADGADTVAFSDTLTATVPSVVAAEHAAFRARRERLRSEIALNEQQFQQREQDLAELTARQARGTASIAPLKRELELTRRMKRRGVVPEIDLLRLERQFAEVSGDLAVLDASVPRARSAIAEARSRVENVRAIFRSEARERLAGVRAELAVIEETLKAARARVARTDIRSPVDGIVNTLAVTTIGAVKGPGEVLAEVVPLDDTLLVEARIRPNDIAFIFPGQDASVKLTAFDYLIYGALTGVVERIGADTRTDEQGEAFYPVSVRTNETEITAKGRTLSVLPGMVATVDIQTGQKSVLDYLLKPLRRVQNEALRER